MKLIEVVVLMGAHCVSPVEHTNGATEASKVQCAVVIERDTQAGTLRIVPAGASRQPEVVAVLNRLDVTTPSETIRPAAATPVSTAAAPVIAPPPAPAAAPEQPAEAPEPAKKKAAAVEKPRPKAAEPATKSKCRGEARPKWYTNAEGRRKYRCVVPG